jgi:hypothetical protein
MTNTKNCIEIGVCFLRNLICMKFSCFYIIWFFIVHLKLHTMHLCMNDFEF